MEDKKNATVCIHTSTQVHARGLCKKCYQYLRDNLPKKTFERMFPAATVVTPKNYVADVYDDLSEIGVTKEEVARKLGITVGAVEKAISRKRAREEEEAVKKFNAAVEALDRVMADPELRAPSHGYWEAGDY